MTGRTDLRRVFLLALLAMGTGLVGCSVLQEQAQPKLAAEVTPGQGPAAPPPAKFSVEIRPEKGQPQRVEKDLTEPLNVQGALEKSGAAKKFARAFIELERPLPSGGWHKMQLEWDRETHRVPPESDYAVLPGDRIIVIEDPTNMLDDAMQRALKPFGIVPPTKRVKASDKYEIRG